MLQVSDFHSFFACNTLMSYNDQFDILQAKSDSLRTTSGVTCFLESFGNFKFPNLSNMLVMCLEIQTSCHTYVIYMFLMYEKLRT